jgi:uncharacterized protein YydD (DUF2326 family)
MNGPLVFNMMEDLPTIGITAEQVGMNMESNSTTRVVEASGNHPPSMNSKEYTPKVNVVVHDTDEEDNEVLLLGNWKGVTEEDYDQFYRHLHAEYKDFDKCHYSYQCKIHGLEGKLKSLHTCIQNLEPEIKDFKALDNEGLRKLAKSEEVQSLDANVCDLEGQLEFERGAMD